MVSVSRAGGEDRVVPRELHLAVIAEGVETTEQLALLRTWATAKSRATTTPGRCCRTRLRRCCDVA
ncbi:MAG: hypothetical protein RLZZ227_192 [Pseudomonadota bacterium]|jgi:hypothetical protein